MNHTKSIVGLSLNSAYIESQHIGYALGYDK